MDQRKDLIIKLRKFKQKLSSNIPISKMILFGSYAYGQIHKWSDVDLIIVSDKFKRRKPFRRARGIFDYWDLEYPVDFLCYTTEEFHKLEKQFTIVKTAVKKGIEI